MKRGELILDLQDPRKYMGKSVYVPDQSKPVIVLKENTTGRNQQFLDTATHEVMSRADFVSAIEAGSYPGYKVISMHGQATPISRPDGSLGNNLG